MSTEDIRIEWHVTIGGLGVYSGDLVDKHETHVFTREETVRKFVADWAKSVDDIPEGAIDDAVLSGAVITNARRIRIVRVVHHLENT